MISKDQAIIMQVAAKIAAELTVKSENVEGTCSDWHMAFNYVNDVLQKGNNLASVVETFNATVETIPAPTGMTNEDIAREIMKPRVTTVRVAGTQHGDLPNWLIAACQKAGVSKVWDNRDKAVGTKRPWFKQADAVEGQEPAAFWPPKGV